MKEVPYTPLKLRGVSKSKFVSNGIIHQDFAIILKRKKNLVALLLLSYRRIVAVNVMWFFLTVPWVGLQCVMVVCPDHSHLHFEMEKLIRTATSTCCFTISFTDHSIYCVGADCRWTWSITLIAFYTIAARNKT